MCGICCYIGKGNASQQVLKGLGCLDHRGYDSIGITRVINKEAFSYKISQKEKHDLNVFDLEKIIGNPGIDNFLAIGHNRWATFGKVSIENAHPHRDVGGKFYLVQNGNVENLKEIETEIGVWDRYSETDTEAIVNLIAKYYQNGFSFEDSVKKTINRLEGANAIVVIKIDEPEKIVVANKGGTIILGSTEDGALVVSDPAAFEPFVIKKQKILLDNEMAVISSGNWEVFPTNNQKQEEDLSKLPSDLENGFEHFMLKEIFEQPASFRNSLMGRIDYNQGITRSDCLRELGRDFRKVKTFHFVGCGTAYNACQYASLLFNRFGIAARAWIASEFCYSHPVFEPNDAFVFISQSGETADTIEVIKEINIKGNITLGIVNVAGSRIWREVHAGIGIRAGKERGVASTKAYTSQLASIVVLAVFLARQRKMNIDTGQMILSELENIPEKINQILEGAQIIEKLAKKYKQYSNYYFLGRYFSSVTAAEGSLKLKEVSYVHAEAYPLGEMKHGPLALIEKGFCSVVIAPDNPVFNKSLVNIQEIKARNGAVLAVTNKTTKLDGIVDDCIFVPSTLDFLSPILSIIPLQLFSYYMSLEYGENPDKPRNLAKTVTVS